MAGIAAAGNWIVDNIKITDAWPQKGELVSILQQEHAGGGAPFNVLTDLRTFNLGLELHGFGCVGDDSNADFIRTHCRDHAIQADHLCTIASERTSYTDVFTVRGSGERTFFHYRGANSCFAPQHVDLDALAATGARLFHFGYLLLLDSMDAPDKDDGIVAAGLLREVQSRGIETSIDVVSEASDRYQRVVRPVLRYTDHCIINELEASEVTGVKIRPADGAISVDAATRAARELLLLGVGRTAVIHFPEGAVWADAAGNEATIKARPVDPGKIVSTVGAGDAFCAGILAGIYHSWSPDRCLQTAELAAAASLLEAGATEGVRSLHEMIGHDQFSE